MKKNILTFAGLALFTLFFSCKKPEETKLPDSYFEVNETVYELSHGFILNWGYQEYEEACIYEIALLSNDLSVYEVNGHMANLYGKGDALYFMIYCDSTGRPEPGEYPYNFHGSAGYMEFAAYTINWEPMVQGDEWKEMAGKIVIAYDQDKYQITIDCFGENGLKIDGAFKGELKMYLENDTYKKGTNLVKQTIK